MRTSSFAAVSIFTFGALVACSGSTSGSNGGNSVSGTVAGTTFSVAAEVASIQAASSTSTSCAVSSDGGVAAGCVPTSTSSGQSVAVLLSNRTALTCAALQSQGSQAYANFDLLTLEAFTETGTLATGTYDIVTSSSAASGALAQFETSTSSCATGVNIQAASAGSITLTEVSSTSLTGTYSVTFGTQGTFTGSFDAPTCEPLDASVLSGADAGPPACQQ